MKISIFFLYLILFFSCKKDNNHEVLAGKTTGLYHYDFTPDISIVYPKLRDSIDVDRDGNFDLFFIREMIPTATGFTDIPIIRSKNKFQVLISKSNSLADTLNYGNPITVYNNWSEMDSKHILLVDYKNVFGNTYRAYGNWLDTDDKYLGVRCNNKFGWIKMTNQYSNKREIVIKEFAFDE